MWKKLLADRWLYVLLALSIVSTAVAYQRTEPFRIDLKSTVDALWLEGFHAPERGPSGPYRWTGPRADVRLPNLWPAQPVRLSLTLSAPRPGAQVNIPVELSVNGYRLATFMVGARPIQYVTELGADIMGASGKLYLTLQAPTFSPPNDLRQLGVIVSGLEVVPTGQAPFLPALPVVATVTTIVGLSYLWLRRLQARPDVAVLVGLGLIASVGIGLVAARPLIALFNARVLFWLVVAFVGSELTARLGRYQSDVCARRVTAILFLVAFAVRLILAHTPGDAANLYVFKLMSEQGTQHGVATVYSLDPVIGAYPPFYHYNLTFAGLLYRTFISPDFYFDSVRLNFMMKMPTIVYDMLITLVVMVYAARQRDARDALWVGAAYALNPGIVYTTAYNGQLGDPMYAAFVTIAVAALLTKHASMLGAATALAVLTKPQASAFVPLLALGALRHLSCPNEPYPHKRSGSLGPPLRVVMAGAVVTLAVLAPFIAANTVGQMIYTLSATIGHGPRISSNAFNIWWLWGWGQAWEIKDTELLFGLVSYRTVGLLLFFVMAYGWVAWKAWTTRGARSLAWLAGFVALAFFMLPTEIHENYLFPVFPLLALIAVHDRRAWGLTAVLTLTWFINVVTIDPTLMEPLTAVDTLLFPIQVAMAVLNVGTLLVWTWWVAREK